MKRVRLGPQIISPVVTRFFWPPEMPLTMLLPTRVSAHTSKPMVCSTYCVWMLSRLPSSVLALLTPAAQS